MKLPPLLFLEPTALSLYLNVLRTSLLDCAPLAIGIRTPNLQILVRLRCTQMIILGNMEAGVDMHRRRKLGTQGLPQCRYRRPGP